MTSARRPSCHGRVRRHLPRRLLRPAHRRPWVCGSLASSARSQRMDDRRDHRDRSRDHAGRRFGRPAVQLDPSASSALLARSVFTAQTACPSVRAGSCAFSFSPLPSLCGACREEGDIQISSLHFNGVEQVDEGALTARLQTRRGSRIPWGRKRYFDRRAFEADLKRIEAFYRDRGFPDARVASFDVAAQRRAGQGRRHPQHLRRRADSPRGHRAGRLRRAAGGRSAGVAGFARRCASVSRSIDSSHCASRERALNELRDHGYPLRRRHPHGARERRPRQRRLIFRGRRRGCWPISATSRSAGT